MNKPPLQVGSKFVAVMTSDGIERRYTITVYQDDDGDYYLRDHDGDEWTGHSGDAYFNTLRGLYDDLLEDHIHGHWGHYETWFDYSGTITISSSEFVRPNTAIFVQGSSGGQVLTSGDTRYEAVSGSNTTYIYREQVEQEGQVSSGSTGPNTDDTDSPQGTEDS